MIDLGTLATWAANGGMHQFAQSMLVAGFDSGWNFGGNMITRSDFK